MKWLFIIVALLNIAFGGYHFFLADGEKTKKIKLSAIEKNQIVQLNELDANALKELQDGILSPQTTIVDIEQSKSDEPSPENEISPDNETFIKEETENNSEAEIASAVDNDQNSAQVSTNATKNLCYKIGPFSKNAMNDIRLILEKEYKNQLSFGIETTSAITYYRIYIPPLESKSKIKQTLAVLDKNGLKDHYVMSIDGRKNAIALGVFKKRSAAEKIAQKAAKIGSSTIIEAISDDKNSLYQLLIIFQKDQDTTPYQEIIAQKKLISVECDK